MGAKGKTLIFFSPKGDKKKLVDERKTAHCVVDEKFSSRGKKTNIKAEKADGFRDHKKGGGLLITTLIYYTTLRQIKLN